MELVVELMNLQICIYVHNCRYMNTLSVGIIHMYIQMYIFAMYLHMYAISPFANLLVLFLFFLNLLNAGVECCCLKFHMLYIYYVFIEFLVSSAALELPPLTHTHAYTYIQTDIILTLRHGDLHKKTILENTFA